MKTFVGRRDEIRALTEPNWRGRALLVAIYGRRRVGKTALIEHAYRDRTLWKFEGLEGENTRTQLALFAKELSRYSSHATMEPIRSWDDALRSLDSALKQYEKSHDQGAVVFFDEFQWMCEMKSALVTLFKYHWDNHLSRRSNVTFVICGSISSFIVKKVIQSRALYGRVDIEQNLKALSPSESKELLSNAVPLAQALETHMVLGGVPQYLLQLNPQLSLIQNLNEYAFKPSGYFFKEFGRLFVSHFVSHPLYESILQRVAKGPLSPSDIAKSCGVQSGGGLTRLLEDLELAGFLVKTTPIDKKPSSRLVRYRINDEYLHFYFTFIAPRTADIVSGQVTFSQIVNEARFRQWQGYAFERLCRKYAYEIADYLRFSGINYRSGEWFRRAQHGESGAQVDLVFVRADKVLTICEMKYVDRLAVKALQAQLGRKKETLRQAFPSYAQETVLILGKDSIGREHAVRDFDHVVSAAEIFYSPYASS